MSDKVKKVIVFMLAILTALAFSPFIFQTPEAPQNTDQSEEGSQVSTSTDQESTQ